ncbi:MAG: hypothetical protein NW214_00860 [Pseudanabaenaceae cyanobacterium bins.39]|nr:hypothetical protein [Pseudanabaenaceae cyanobacterium bins.39]
MDIDRSQQSNNQKATILGDNLPKLMGVAHTITPPQNQSETQAIEIATESAPVWARRKVIPKLANRIK